jgi:hypothetical protein
MAVYGIAQRGLTVQKRREDACALPKLARNRTGISRGFRAKCFGVRCVFASLLLLLDFSRLVHSEIVGYFDSVGLE